MNVTTERIAWGPDLLGRHLPNLAVIAKIQGELTPAREGRTRLSVETFDIIDGWNTVPVDSDGCIEVLADNTYDEED